MARIGGVVLSGGLLSSARSIYLEMKAWTTGMTVIALASLLALGCRHAVERTGEGVERAGHKIERAGKK